MARIGANGGRSVGLLVTGASLAVLGFLLFQSYRDESRRAVPAPAPVEQPAPAPVPAAPPTRVSPPAVGRANLIDAASAAASAYARQAGAAAAPSPLIGRRFQLRLPFGCEGPLRAGETRSASWSYSPDGESIRIVVRPEIWTDSALIREIGGGPDAFEAVEGFWVSRPWLLAETCPVVATDPLAAGAPAPSPETVGLGIFFEAGASRVARREDRPYEIVLRREEGAPPPAPQGFRLRLDGRVTGFPDGRAFRCRSAAADLRPVCIAAVQIDTVAVEDPATGAILGSWEGAQLGAAQPTREPAS